MAIRAVVIGNTLFTKYCLEALIQESIEIVCVLQTSPKYSVEIIDYHSLFPYCKQSGLEYRQFSTLGVEVVNFLTRFMPDVIFIFGYSGLVPDALIRLPFLSCIGSYEGLLPKYSGDSPIPWTILKKIPQSGITFFNFSGVRKPFGNIILQESFDVEKDDDAGSLYKKICEIGSDLIHVLRLEIMLDFPSQKPFSTTEIQEYWRLFSKEDCHIIDWAQSCEDILKIIRASTIPYHGAWFHLDEKKTIAWKAKIGKHRTQMPPGSVVYRDDDHLVMTTGTEDLDIIKYEIM